MDDLVNQAIKYHKSGDEEKAERYLLFATQLNPDNIHAWIWLSAVKKHLPDRIECLEEVLRIDPTNEVALNGLQILRKNQPIPDEYSQNVPITEQSSLHVKNQDIWSAPVLPQSRESESNRKQEKKVFVVKPSLKPTIVAGGFQFLALIVAYLILTNIFQFTNSGFLTPYYISLISILFPFFGVMLTIIIVFRILLLHFTTYTLTTFRLVLDSGILSKHHKVIPIHKIQDVAYHQTLLERLMNVGDVIVESAGEKSAIHLLDLENCVQRSQHILSVMKI